MEFQFRLIINEKKTKKKFFRVSRGESIDHVLLKLIGYIMFSQYKPGIEKRVGWRYKPDLVAFNDSREINLWVECSQVSPEKIKKILHKFPLVRLIVLKLKNKDAQNFSKLFVTEKSKGAKLEIIGFEDEFMDLLCKKIYNRAQIKANTTENLIEINLGDIKISSEIYRF